jgi:hypothetical protein
MRRPRPEGERDRLESVVKIFTPDGKSTWLLTELDSNGENLAFGLCDLGLGEPELGYVSLHELAAARGPWAYASSATSISRRRARSRATRSSRATISTS